MTLVESYARDEPTHAVRTRSLPGVEDWDEAGMLAVENRAVKVAMNYGSAVHLGLDRSLLAERAPDRLSTARERFDRVDDSRRILRNGYPEYRAQLPDDSEVVRSCLALEPGDTDGWLARLFGVAEFAVVTDDSWLYRSVPHHAHVRELNAEPADGLVADVAATLEPIRGSGVVPTGALASWTDDEHRYELLWDALRRRERDRDGDAWTVFDLERLRSVDPEPERETLRFRWRSRASGTDSTIRRAVASAVDRLSTDPPTRVVAPDGETVDDIASTLRELRAQFDYAFEIRNR